MSRELRIECPGAFYHVMAHGNGLQWIYKNNQNMRSFLKILADVKLKYNFLIHAFELMKNHYHILLETPKGNLCKGMLKLNSTFARLLNINLNRKGSIFKQRYKSILVEKESYYLNLIRYIYQNPVRAKIVEKPEDYPGSSLYYLKRNEKFIYNILSLKDQIHYFGKDNFILNLINYVNERSEKKPKTDKYKYLLGDKEWINKIKSKYISGKLNEEIIDHDNLTSKEINENQILTYINTNNIKNPHTVLIYLYDKYSGITQKEIAERFNLKTQNSVRQRLFLFKKKLLKYKLFAEKISKLEKKYL